MQNGRPVCIHVGFGVGTGQIDGGTKRSCQLRNVFGQLGIDSISLYPSKKELLLNLVRSPLSAMNLVLACLLMLVQGLTCKGAFRFVLLGTSLLRALKEKNVDRVLLEVAPDDSLMMMHLLVLRQTKFVAFPHNIECMVRAQEQYSFRRRDVAFRFEMEGYKRAENVVCISDFDRAILGCQGIQATVLAYYPIANEVKELHFIASQRGGQRLGGYLVLGTAQNSATYLGMKAILAHLEGSPINEPFYVVGNGTEVFQEFATDRLHILGRVSQEHLNALLTTCRAVLINQPQTAGFLTRLVEMNLAGVPVVMLGEYLQADSFEDLGIIRRPGFLHDPGPLPTVIRKFEEPKPQILESVLTPFLSRGVGSEKA